MSKMKLELYVMGQSARSRTAIENLRRICETKLVGQFELQIIDVLEQPQAAEDWNIMVTPTLIKRAPPPIRRLLGDLSMIDIVLRGLGIDDDDGNEGTGGQHGC